MVNTNKKTVRLADTFDVTTSYQNIEQPADLGAVHAHGGQVVLTFKRTGGTSIIFKVQELFSYQEAGVEAVGYTTRQRVDGLGTGLEEIELTETDTEFTYAFPTLADKVRVQVKGGDGNEVLDLLMTVGQIM